MMAGSEMTSVLSSIWMPCSKPGEVRQHTVGYARPQPKDLREPSGSAAHLGVAQQAEHAQHAGQHHDLLKRAEVYHGACRCIGNLGCEVGSCRQRKRDILQAGKLRRQSVGAGQAHGAPKEPTQSINQLHLLSHCTSVSLV